MKLIQGNCLEVMRNFENESIDLVVTSPPYDNLRTYNNGNIWGEDEWKGCISQLYRIIKEGGVVVWVVGDATIKGSETGTSFKQALWAKECGFNLHDTMIFEKNSMSMPDSNRYYQKFEYMFVLSKGRPKAINRIKDHPNTAERWSKKFTTTNKDGSKNERTREIEHNKYGIRFNIWKYNTGKGFTSNGKINHPAMFPQGLAEDHILSWSNVGDVVLDPMMGSGTTGIASNILGRDFIGIEVNEDYYNIAVNRIEESS